MRSEPSARRVVVVGAGLAGLACARRGRAPPAQPPGALEPPRRPVRLGERLFVCGDHRDNASIQGAIDSGNRAAEAVLAVGAHP